MSGTYVLTGCHRRPLGQCMTSTAMTDMTTLIGIKVSGATLFLPCFVAMNHCRDAREYRRYDLLSYVHGVSQG